jgi:hypothetical protein
MVQGPWWDSSSWCKVGGATGVTHYGGLPREELEEAAAAFIIQLPIEVFSGPLDDRFWTTSDADVAR